MSVLSPIKAVGERRAAQALLSQGRFSAAEAAYEELLERRPGDRAALVGLGYLMLLGNRLELAAARLRAALVLAPRNRIARTLLAETLRRQDNYLEAAPLFDTVGRRAYARKLASFREPPYRLESGPAASQVPFLQTDPLPIVELSIAGSAPLPFLIDTGGGELIVDGSVAERIGLERFGSELETTYAGGRSAATEHVKVDALRLGDVELRHVPAIAVSLEEVGSALGRRDLAGILGTLVLARFCSTIDYADGRLVLEPPGSQGPQPAVSIPFWQAEHLVIAEGALNGGEPTMLIVDTGLAGSGFTGPPSSLEQAAVAPDEDAAFDGPGLGGMVRCSPFVLEQLRLGAVTRERVPGVAGAFPLALERSLGFGIGGLVSHEFFRSGALTLDFDRMELGVSPA